MGERHDLGSIMQILVPVADVDRAAEFYEKRARPATAVPLPGQRVLRRRRRPAVPRPADRARISTARATIYFRVEDVTGTLERLEAAGAKVRERPEIVFGTDDYDLWLAFVQDPDGNNIGLMREAPKGTERG